MLILFEINYVNVTVDMFRCCRPAFVPCGIWKCCYQLQSEMRRLV